MLVFKSIKCTVEKKEVKRYFKKNGGTMFDRCKDRKQSSGNRIGDT